MRKQILVPRKLMIAKTADGTKVRVLSLNGAIDKVRVKRLSDGFPFTLNRAFLFEDVPA